LRGSPEQTAKARHAFARSAKQAGFFAHGEDRLVLPANSGPATKPIEEPRPEPEKEKISKSGGGGGPTDLHPFIVGLLKELPPAGQPWPESNRKLWLDTAASIFKMIYKDDDLSGKDGNTNVPKGNL
jgi:hypothetical protein